MKCGRVKGGRGTATATHSCWITCVAWKVFHSFEWKSFSVLHFIVYLFNWISWYDGEPGLGSWDRRDADTSGFWIQFYEHDWYQNSDINITFTNYHIHLWWKLNLMNILNLKLCFLIWNSFAEYLIIKFNGSEKGWTRCSLSKRISTE